MKTKDKKTKRNEITTQAHLKQVQTVLETDVIYGYLEILCDFIICFILCFYFCHAFWVRLTCCIHIFELRKCVIPQKKNKKKQKENVQ